LNPLRLFAICLAILLLQFACLYETSLAVTVGSGPVELTPEEIEWLAEHQEIRVGLRETPPLVMREDKSGSIYGLSLDYVRLLERRLGVRFRLIYFDTWSGLIESARNKEVDVMVTATWTPERSAWLSYSRPYIVLVNKIIARQGSFDKIESVEQLKGKTVAVLEGSALHEYMKRYEGLLTLAPKSNERIALADVSFGAVDVAVMDIARASYYIQQENITNLEIVGDVGYNYEYGFSSRKDWPLLGSILVKGLSSISREEREAIYRKWVASLTAAPSILSSKMFWLSIAGSGMFVFVIMLLFWNRTLRHRILKSNTELLAITEQLHQAQKMEAVGQLAGGIAHDFNNILMAIIGYGDILRLKVKDDPRLLRHVDQIIESANRAANLTNDLLAFSRRKILNPEVVELNGVIENMLSLLRGGMGGNIEIKTLFGREMTVYIESNQIELALINLANNARDAMPDGGVLTIETSDVEMNEEFRRVNGFGKEGRYAVISVSDTGTGMDEETKLRIFEPFFTTKVVGKGTGLGLSMVYGVIKQHYGYIKVESEPGKGATFKIYLPLLPDGVAIEKSSAVIIEENPPGGTETLLVAEDDRVLRDLNRKILGDAGYTVIEAVNGEDAIARFLEFRNEIDLVILDVIMPKKSGMEAFIEIRKSRPNIRALFVSGHAADKLSESGISAQVSDSEIIFKPVMPAVLLKKVRNILDRQT